MSILKDYHLCEDLTRLNHDDYFHSHFDTPQLTDSLCMPATSIEFQEQSRNLCIYVLNLSHTEDKSVYIMLKWLLVAHRIAKKAKYNGVVREMEDALGRMDKGKIQSRYDHYLFQRLLKPYKHYLQKLCLLLQRQPRASKYDQEQEQRIQEWFMKYNLVKYALFEFCPSLGEFIPFFNQHFPFLSKIAVELGQDLQRLTRELKSGYKAQQIKLVQREQLQIFDEEYGKMRQFLPPQTEQTLLFTDSEFCPNKVQHFFESASKVEGSVLFA